MPRRQERNSSRRRRTSSPSLEICDPVTVLSNAKNPDGAGRGLYKGLRRGCQRLLCTAQHCVRNNAQASMAPHASARAQPPVRLAHQPARRRPEAGKALCPPARPRSAARGRSAVSSARGRRRPPRAAEAARRAGRPGGHRGGDGRRSPARSAASRARALSHLRPRRHRRHHADLFQRAQGLPGETLAGGRDALRLRHRRILRRHAADGASRPGGGRERLRRAAADRAGLSAHGGAGARQCAARDGGRVGAAARSAGMAGRGLGRARALSRLRRRATPSAPAGRAARHRAGEPGVDAARL